METLFNIVQNAVYIVEGYAKWAYDKITGAESQRAAYRLKICQGCIHNMTGTCGLCGCVLKAKVRVKFPLDADGKSIDGCPIKLW